MTDAGVLELTVLDEELDFGIICDARSCGLEPKWQGKLDCPCRRLLLVCNGHRQMLDTMILASPIGAQDTAGCKGVVMGVMWEPYDGGSRG